MRYTRKTSAGILARHSFRLGMIFGWVFAGHQIDAATAAYGAGLTRTLLLTYSPSLYVAGTACLVAALMPLSIRRKDRAAAPAAA